MNKRKYIYGLILCLLFLSFISINFNSEKEKEYVALDSVNIISLKIENKLNQMAKNKELVSYSSSPYTIVKNISEYNDLVNIGIDAVSVLYNKISNSSESGLMEYIYAMAIEDIMSQNFDYNSVQMNSNNYNYGWANSLEFKEAFSGYMKMIPDLYKEIKEDDSLTNDDKVNNIMELGLGAIPYVIDDINNNESDLDYKNVLESILISRNVIKIESRSNDNFDLDEWINLNRNSYNQLKNIY